MGTEHQLRNCDECGSDYLRTMSQMANLCPECAHWIYDYPRCYHEFEDGRCSRCGWDGSLSDFVRRIQNQSEDQELD